MTPLKSPMADDVDADDSMLGPFVPTASLYDLSGTEASESVLRAISPSRLDPGGGDGSKSGILRPCGLARQHYFSPIHHHHGSPSDGIRNNPVAFTVEPTALTGGDDSEPPHVANVAHEIEISVNIGSQDSDMATSIVSSLQECQTVQPGVAFLDGHTVTSAMTSVAVDVAASRDVVTVCDDETELEEEETEEGGDYYVVEDMPDEDSAGVADEEDEEDEVEEDEEEEDEEDEDEEEEEVVVQPAPAAESQNVGREVEVSVNGAAGPSRCRNRFACDLCDKRFSRTRELNQHKDRHTNTKRHKCHICQKGFYDPSHLHSHMTVHSNERPFVCELTGCGKGFKSAALLKRHKTTHVAQGSKRPHVCQVCSKGYTTENNLRNHMKVHTHPVYCGECGMKFGRQLHLDDHLRTHTGSRPYKCKLCTADFSQQSGLNRHKKQMHGNGREGGKPRRRKTKKEQGEQYKGVQRDANSVASSHDSDTLPGDLLPPSLVNAVSAEEVPIFVADVTVASTVSPNHQLPPASDPTPAFLPPPDAGAFSVTPESSRSGSKAAHGGLTTGYTSRPSSAFRDTLSVPRRGRHGAGRNKRK